MTNTLGEPPQRTFEHVAVLMGGLSAERSVSLRSGAAVADALEGEGYRVTRIDVDRDIAARLAAVRPDVCFNALHGRFGEDGCIQGILEMMAIPYTHSGVLASALAMHKENAKAIMRLAGVPVAEAKLLTRSDAAAAHALPPPYVVKPVDEGSSVGVLIIRPGNNDWSRAILEGGAPEQVVMVERFIPGRELTCAVIGDFATDVIEIVPQKGLAFYDFEAKYAPGGSTHELPADILPNVYQLIRKYTLAAHASLGCRGVSRADFRFDDTDGGTGELICLEVNTQPGMTGTSLVPELAAHAGWSFGKLVRWIVEDASCSR
ncbi:MULTISPECIES: D-alanine--D-alanine ligase [Hyphomicrobium]|jgi:D-alanine-D-alanine ligase|uniref:D-alanine--D-alanine ligase n=1 Tax=Hyphomicrobium TaxID=81 RepID=UPI00036745E4|nr:MULTISPECIES: D-alanine--D-alanine ligase [Hyphomicrobium]WBT37619.1 D-alanine--D-alanine ligase [Hyphomicrobium sp. DMF-1]HML43867.1 D-alanine--D-alanine ligase [Hyphomicrobium zavarzinii]